MRDYADQINSLRLCAESDDPVDECCWENCNQHHGRRDNMCRQKIMVDAADAIEELVTVVNYLESCIDQALDALDRGADNNWARDALEKAVQFLEPPKEVE